MGLAIVTAVAIVFAFFGIIHLLQQRSGAIMPRQVSQMYDAWKDRYCARVTFRSRDAARDL